MVGRCGIVYYIQPPNNNQETQSDSTGSQPNFYEYYDTILQPSDIPDCYSAGSQPARDTIEYTISCDDLRYSYACNYELEFYDMPDDADAVCQYYFNDTLIDSVVYNDSTSPWRVELFPSRFPIDRSDASRFNWRSLSLKIIIDGVEYNFKFSYNDNTTEMANHLAQLPNIQLDADMHGGTLTLDSNTLTQSIQLPASSDCSYDIGMYSPSTSFAIPPSIDSNNVLHFELKADICSINLPIFLRCECGGLFDLTVKNSSCPESACEFVTIAAVPKITDTVSTGGKYGTDINLPAYNPLSYNNTEYVVTSATGSDNDISYVTVNEIIAQGKYASIKNQTVTSLNDTSYNVLISFITPICGDTAAVSNYKICAYLTNGAVCCDTFSFYLHCVPPPDMLTWERSASKTITYQILNVALFYSPTVPPLYVKVFDGTGTQLITTLHSAVPTSLTGSISYGHLPIGTYNIVFQWGNYIWTVKVMNTGGSR